MMVVIIIFWISIAAILHTYAIYPLFMKLLGSLIKKKTSSAPANIAVSVLIAAYNEEKVIAQKIRSVLQSDYPGSLIEILVGSDSSTDRTKEIVQSFNEAKLIHFEKRSGKVKIINELSRQAKGDILIITDANVMFDKSTIGNLISAFEDPKVGLADSRMINTGQVSKGISKAEGTYIKGEASLKVNEGRVFGTMIGPFGGCYAVKKELYEPVPEHFLVDDFYVNMKVLEKRMKAVSQPQALVFEEVPSDWRVEFKRKIRIAAGSIQNLSAFFHLLFRFNAVSFCFFSHKVLRWFGPFFLASVYLTSFLISGWIAAVDTLQHVFAGEEYHIHLHGFQFFFLVQNLILLIVPIDLIFRLMNLHFLPFRLVTHFFTSNLAILLGWFRFFGGIRSGIWNPTAR